MIALLNAKWRQGSALRRGDMGGPERKENPDDDQEGRQDPVSGEQHDDLLVVRACE
jgi:hypothetical protein